MSAITIGGGARAAVGDVVYFYGPDGLGTGTIEAVFITEVEALAAGFEVAEGWRYPRLEVLAVGDGGSALVGADEVFHDLRPCVEALIARKETLVARFQEEIAELRRMLAD